MRSRISVRAAVAPRLSTGSGRVRSRSGGSLGRLTAAALGCASAMWAGAAWSAARDIAAAPGAVPAGSATASSRAGSHALTHGIRPVTAGDRRSAEPVLSAAPGTAADLSAPPAQPAGDAGTVERARYLMGSPCRITVSHAESGRAEALIEAAFGEIERLNGVLSDWDRTSELSRLNAAFATGASRPAGPDGAFTCSSDLFDWLSGSLALAERTGGALDPTVGALVDLYALRRGGRWPSEEELTSTMARTGHRLVELDSARLTARFRLAGIRLDPGANGKGLALDAAARVLREGGVAWALLDFGGQVLAVGGGPGGGGFEVDLPSGSSARTILLRDASVATSSNLERGLLVDGRPLGHILDPRTGRPVDLTGSLSVVAPTAALADALSTAFFVMGPDSAMEAAGRFGVEAAFAPAPGSALAARTTPGFRALISDTIAGAAPAAPAPTTLER